MKERKYEFAFGEIIILASFPYLLTIVYEILVNK